MTLVFPYNNFSASNVIDKRHEIRRSPGTDFGLEIKYKCWRPPSGAGHRPYSPSKSSGHSINHVLSVPVAKLVICRIVEAMAAHRIALRLQSCPFV